MASHHTEALASRLKFLEDWILSLAEDREIPISAFDLAKLIRGTRKDNKSTIEHYSEVEKELEAENKELKEAENMDNFTQMMQYQMFIRDNGHTDSYIEYAHKMGYLNKHKIIEENKNDE
jgi:hypothetical protein